MPKFKVTGYASVPVQIAVTVEAESKAEAMEAARETIKKRGGLRDAVVPNSEDEASVDDGRLYEAEELPS